MAVVFGGIAGMITGAIGSLVASIVQLLARHLRNARLGRRGEPPSRDTTFPHFWPLCAILGAIAGAAWTWRLDGTWVTGAIAGACVPACATLVLGVIAVARLRP
jgi:hypothetical protein